MRYKMFSDISGLSKMPLAPLPCAVTAKIPPDIVKHPLSDKITPAQNHLFRVTTFFLCVETRFFLIERLFS